MSFSESPISGASGSSEGETWRIQHEFTPAPERERSRGLLGRFRLKVSGFVIEPIGVHRRPDGEITFRYPDRKDQRGRRWPVVAPENRSIRERLEMEMRDVVRRELEAR